MGKKYFASGFVYGKNWGGGFSAYPCIKLQANTEEDLLIQAKKELKSGGLDSGMGYESLKGALLNIEEVETITVKNKNYNRSEYFIAFIGDLTEQEQDFLLSIED
jgi:hypothetical protein